MENPSPVPRFVRRMGTISYPFIKHIPIVVAMSMSHVSGCAMMCRDDEATRFQITSRSVGFHSPGTERETAGYKHRVAPGAAMIGNGDNDTPAQSQSERDRVFRREAVAGNESSRQRTCRG